MVLEPEVDTESVSEALRVELMELLSESERVHVGVLATVSVRVGEGNLLLLRDPLKLGEADNDPVTVAEFVSVDEVVPEGANEGDSDQETEEDGVVLALALPLVVRVALAELLGVREAATDAEIDELGVCEGVTEASTQIASLVTVQGVPTI
jgi:hypothetical protein